MDHESGRHDEQRGAVICHRPGVTESNSFGHGDADAAAAAAVTEAALIAVNADCRLVPGAAAEPANAIGAGLASDNAQRQASRRS